MQNNQNKTKIETVNMQHEAENKMKSKAYKLQLLTRKKPRKKPNRKISEEQAMMKLQYGGVFVSPRDFFFTTLKILNFDNTIPHEVC